jgi:hypothetical protein
LHLYSKIIQSESCIYSIYCIQYSDWLFFRISVQKSYWKSFMITRPGSKLAIIGGIQLPCCNNCTKGINVVIYRTESSWIVCQHCTQDHMIEWMQSTAKYCDQKVLINDYTDYKSDLWVTKHLFCMTLQYVLSPWYKISYILAVSFIGGGNRSTRRKPSICRKSLTNFIT